MSFPQDQVGQTNGEAIQQYDLPQDKDNAARDDKFGEKREDLRPNG